MLKIIAKILVILALAGMISAGIYLYVNQSGQSLPAGEGTRGGFPPPGMNTGTAFQPPERQMERFGERGEHDQFSLARGAGGLIKNTGILAAVMLAVIFLQKGWRLIFRRKAPTRPVLSE